ncbi:hypothetical protein F444_14191 [Phytophthora nicotianae P1976]|uniref:Chromo domain-containing protein n=1 Tax=Phytophthora nicotianae P1976 TaxID=1317066 RepID=A0A080ZR75_PHYNI|nr:hypothetical protein F444_14191 [Phytophthora nicotianae P1976]
MAAAIAKHNRKTLAGEPDSSEDSEFPEGPDEQPAAEKETAAQQVRLVSATTAQQTPGAGERVGSGQSELAETDQQSPADVRGEPDDGIAAASTSLGEMLGSEVDGDAATTEAVSVIARPAGDEEMAFPGGQEVTQDADSMDVDEVAEVENRPRRPAAVRAREYIAVMSAEDLRPIREPRKRRVEAADEELEDQQEEDEAVDDIAEVRCLTEREDRDGERWYRVRWKDVKEGEQEYAWVPEADVAGAPNWKAVVDRYYDEALPKNPDLLFTHFIDQGYEAIVMGDSKDHSCVYTALTKIMELQGIDMRITTEMVTAFEHREKFDRTERKGLRSDQIERFVEFLVRRGWKSHMHSNQYVGGKTGSEGLALATKGVPGLYFVGTLEPPRIGHCFVLEVTERSAVLRSRGRLDNGLEAIRVSDAAVCAIEGVDGPLDAPAAKQARRRTRNRRPKRAKTGATGVPSEAGLA